MFSAVPREALMLDTVATSGEKKILGATELELKTSKKRYLSSMIHLLMYALIEESIYRLFTSFHLVPGSILGSWGYRTVLRRSAWSVDGMGPYV